MDIKIIKMSENNPSESKDEVNKEVDSRLPQKRYIFFFEFLLAMRVLDEAYPNFSSVALELSSNSGFKCF